MVEFGRVEPVDWGDRPAIIVGTGPSLAGFDHDRLRGLGNVLAVKEAVWDLPFADACFGLDLPWMRRQGDRLIDVAARMQLYLAIPPVGLPPGHRPIPGAIHLVRRRTCNQFSEDPAEVESGGNSGFGAVNVALLKGARTIVLFGFDYTHGHYCPDRYAHQRPDHNARYWPRWGDNFRITLPQLAGMGASVLNASPGSTVDAFPKVTIDEAVEHLRRL